MQNLSRLLDARELAMLLNVHPNTISNWLATDPSDLPDNVRALVGMRVKLGSKLNRWRDTDVQSWMERAGAAS